MMVAIAVVDARSIPAPIHAVLQRLRLWLSLVYTGYGGVPLGEASRNGAVYRRRAQVGRSGRAAAYVAVHHAIAEAGEQLGGEAEFFEELVILGLAMAVYQDVGTVAIGAQQDGVTVSLVIGPPASPVDRLQQRVRDAVGEAYEIKLGVGGLPLRPQRQYQFPGRVRVRTIVG